MPITWTELAQGQLPNAVGVLYAAAAGVYAAVQTISVYNTNAPGGAAVTVSVYKWRGVPGDTVLFSVSLAAAHSLLYEGHVTLEPGGMIRGDDGGAGGAVIDYVISGAEET